MEVTVLAFLFLSSIALARTPISFQQFPAGDSIHVTFTSSGCFHHQTYEFDFQRAGTVTAKVSRVEGRRIPIGTVTLSETEIAGLDRLLKFYRSWHIGGCTTVDSIILTQTSCNTVKATESYTDRTCATYNMKNLTLFYSIVAKLKPKTK